MQKSLVETLQLKLTKFRPIRLERADAIRKGEQRFGELFFLDRTVLDDVVQRVDPLLACSVTIAYVFCPIFGGLGLNR